MNSVYCNSVNVRFTGYEFIIDFSLLEIDGKESEVLSRVRMSPILAKEIAASLPLMVHRFEEMNGKIPLKSTEPDPEIWGNIGEG